MNCLYVTPLTRTRNRREITIRNFRDFRRKKKPERIIIVNDYRTWYFAKRVSCHFFKLVRPPTRHPLVVSRFRRISYVPAFFSYSDVSVYSPSFEVTKCRTFFFLQLTYTFGSLLLSGTVFTFKLFFGIQKPSLVGRRELFYSIRSVMARIGFQFP